MNRFMKLAAATALPISGYIVPPDAETYHDWRKVDVATPVIDEGLRMLRQTLNSSLVGDWFNEIQPDGRPRLPVGPYCRNTRWDGKMVRRFYANRLLGGMPGRGFRHTVKHHETGRRISVRNGEGPPQFHPCPNLAHVDLAELDEVNAMLAAKNGKLGRKPVNGQDPRTRVPKKRTRWPGQQHAACWHCGGDCVWGGNGITANLMCNRAREWRCWNSIGFEGELLARRTVEAITEKLYELERFDEQFRHMVARAGEDAGGELARKSAQLDKDEQALAAKEENIKKTMAAIGPDPLVLDTLKEIRDEKTRLAVERQRLQQAAKKTTLELPGSVAELRVMLQEEFARLATSPHEFGLLMRKLVPSFSVYLVRL